MAYAKKYNFEADAYPKKEFKPQPELTWGTSVGGNEQKYLFDGLLVGEDRQLIFNVKKDVILLSESKVTSNPLKRVVLYKTIGEELFKEGKVISEPDLVKSGIKQEEIQDHFVLIRVLENLGSFQSAQYVSIRRSDENKQIFIHEFPKQDAYIYVDQINWKQRDRLKYIGNQILYHSGLLITVPLDIVTSPIQFIGGVYILFSGGFVK